MRGFKCIKSNTYKVQPENANRGKENTSGTNKTTTATFSPLHPHTTADRYAHLQLSSFTLPAGHILKPCFLSIHFNITLSFMHRSKLWLSIQASDAEITACQYNDCKVCHHIHCLMD